VSRLLRVAFWLAMAASLWLALAPHVGPELPPGPWDKIEHFFAFYALTLFALLAYRSAPRLWVLAGMVGYGALIEALQAIPALNRNADGWDLLADALGIGAALLPTLIHLTGRRA